MENGDKPLAQGEDDDEVAVVCLGGLDEVARDTSSTRYFVLLLCVVCFTSLRSNDMAFNFTVICMTDNTTNSYVNMAPTDVSLIFSSSGIGSFTMSLPAAFLLQRIGGRQLMAVMLVASSIVTALIPFVAKNFDAIYVVPLRIAQGCGLACVFPMMGFVTAHWAPITEIAFFTTLLSSAGQFCQIFTMPLSAHLCVASGWEWAYYVHALISAVLAVVFFACFRNSPQKHPCVSSMELELIHGVGIQHRKRRDQRVPHCAIARTHAVWAVWIAFLGNSFGFQLVVQFMPTYMNKVLHVPIERTGFSAVVPPVTQLILKIIISYFCDRITCISERKKLQLFNTIAMCGCGIFLLPVGSGGDFAGSVALICFTLSMSSIGLVTCGSMKSATLVARQYSHFVMAIVQTVVCFGMLSIPFIVAVLTPNSTIGERRVVFGIVCTILIATNGVFCLLCDAEPAEWTKEPVVVPSESLLPADPQLTVTTTT